jgi:hypothetical protein
MSEFDGQMKSRDWSKSPLFPAPWRRRDQMGASREVFRSASEVLQQVPPLPDEEALDGMINSVLQPRRTLR